MKKAPPTIALAALTAAALVGITLPAPAVAAGSTDTIAVDFSQSTGEFRGGATGTLYGLGDHGAPTQALIDGAHITNTSQKAPFGTQHPSGDSLKVEDGFFAKHGEDMYIYVQDYYPDWAYHGGVRPGDTRTYDLATGSYTPGANGVWDYLEVVEFVTEAVATSSDRPEDYVHIPFNEPDAGNWYNNWGALGATFLADWEVVYDKIQEVYARHGLGHARIGGPGDASYQPERTAEFLDAALATGTLPDVMIWHELGIDNLATFRSHLSHYRGLEDARGITDLPINITEYGMLRDMGTPGQLIQWLAMFEDTKVDAQTAYWNYAGNLSDNSARANAANAGWWMFKWYGDLEGATTVALTPPELDVADTLQGIAAVDAQNARATVLYGGTRKSTVTLDLSGLDPAVFGAAVDIEVREATLSGAEGLHGTPRVVFALDGAALTDGTLDLTVPSYDRYAAYQVVITPDQERTVTTDGVWQTSIEAENTTLTSATAYNQNPTDGGGWKFLASGGKDVGSFNRATSAADWTVTVPRTGTYRYQVVGATPGTPGRHALFVDGTRATTVQYTADLALTNAQRWQYRGSAEVEIELTAGEHVLSLRASDDGATRLPNSDITLDKLLLTDITDGEPTVYPASTMRFFGGAKVTYDTPGARGLASIAAGQRADVYTTAWESGYHDVTVRFDTDAASSIDVSVNGRLVTSLTAPGKGSWISTAQLHLAEGINEIELRSATGVRIASLTTVRDAAADSQASTVEAESAVLTGSAAVRTPAQSVGSNASGGSYVGSVGYGTGNAIEIPRGAGVDGAGLYDIVVRYANAETQGQHAYNPQVVDRRLDVTEKGSSSTVGSAYFRYTYSWESFWERTIPVTLTSTGTAVLLHNADGWAPNIDRITIAPVMLGTPTTTRAPDTAAPTVSLAAGPAEPTGANGWYTSDVVLTASAVDDVDGAPIVETQVDGGEWVVTTAPVTVSADGEHTLSARARDAAGNVSEPVAVDVAIDRTAPTTTAVVTPASGTAAAGLAVGVVFAATDETSGVASTEYSVDGDTWVAAPVAGVSFTSVGSHTVLFRSVDTAGNAEESQSVTLTVTDAATPPVPPAPLPGATDRPAAQTPTPTPTTDSRDGLPVTGSTIGWTVAGALVLLLGGTGLVVARRRRLGVAGD